MYLDLLFSGVNLGLQFTEASIFLRTGEPIARGVVCPDVVAAAALFAASSGRSLRWRLGGTILAATAIWLLQSALIVLQLQLAIHHYAGGEVVALIREWSGAALVLPLWFSAYGSLLRGCAHPQDTAAIAQESVPVTRSGRGSYRKMSKGQKKHQRRIRQQYAGRALLRMALAGRRQERAGLRLAIATDPMRNAPCQYSTMLSQVRWSPGLIPSMSV
ncbi:MAG: hypothetical protein CME20_24405 [Gemmatimonadetes bacterium]|nr:hypothetical protein [Gemmatimonadota bacterium]|tara:strand:+ start:298 stop:948 length:651 start_codon:yes stop_codon:yes gene_type:complete